MNSAEKKEIESLPEKYRPLGAWAYFGYSILFAIPIIGFICLIVFACSSANINRRSYARSFFCGYIIVAILFIVLILISGVSFAALFGQIKDIFAGLLS